MLLCKFYYMLGTFCRVYSRSGLQYTNKKKSFKHNRQTTALVKCNCNLIGPYSNSEKTTKVIPCRVALDTTSITA